MTKTYIVPVKGGKQKRITIPIEASEIQTGDYIKIQKIVPGDLITMDSFQDQEEINWLDLREKVKLNE